MTAPASTTVDHLDEDPTVTEPDEPAGPTEPDHGPTTATPMGDPPATGRVERIALVVGFVALAGAVIGTRWGVFTPDTRPDLYEQPGRFLRQSVEAWVGGATGLGQGNFNAGAAPVAAVVWVLRALGASPWLSVRLWRLLLLVVAAWGIRHYLGALLGSRLTPAARFVVTVFWLVNPYVIVAGNTTPILLPYAILPWSMYAFLRAARDGGWRWPAVFALTFFVQSGLNAGVVPFFQLAALPAHLAYVHWIERRRWRPLLGALARCGLLSVAVSLYWLAPSLLASGTGASIASSTENPRDVARTSSYAETSRLLGHWALYGRSGNRFFLGGYTVYLTNPLVVAATFAVPVAVGASLWRSRARARLLVVGLLVVALPLMVGIFPGTDPYPAGRALRSVFDHVPASLAFRTTNKVGAVVVLAYAVALALGWRAAARALARRSTAVRLGGVGLVALVLIGIATPLWNGSLYPLGYDVPATWRDATAALDAQGGGRVLVAPGGTGGNYRWGMRSPDDLFPSYLSRPVVSRNTVVGAGDPAGNFLTWFDTGLQQGALPPTGLSTTARYLGADDVVVRNDVLSEETSGADPIVTARAAAGDPGLTAGPTYGRRGTDTVPGTSGPVTKASRAADPDDAALPPIEVFPVKHPMDAIAAAPASRLVIVDGDGAAFAPLTGLSILDGSQPVRYLGDLTRSDLVDAVRGGARIVLTDTNQRRAWDINRLLDASSPVLAADQPFTLGNGPSVTLWPDDPDKQSVATEGATVARVTSDISGFGLQPWGKPALAVDGNPTTAWMTGGFLPAVGGHLRIDLTRPQRIDSVVIRNAPTEPARITRVQVTVGDQSAVVPLLATSDPVTVPIAPGRADRVVVTVLDQTEGSNPVGLQEVQLNDGTIAARDGVRLPRTLTTLTTGATGAERRALDAAVGAAPLDVVLTRLRGRLANTGDDEEFQLNRSFELPTARTFTFAADLAPEEIDPLVLEEAIDGRAACYPVADVDGSFVRARITSSPTEITKGRVHVAGCGPLKLSAGPHEVTTVFGWRLNRIHLSSPGTIAPTSASSRSTDGGRVHVTSSSPTRVEAAIDAADGPRYLRLGTGYDERWTLRIDGRDAGRPVLVDGYSIGWLVDGKAHRLEVDFPAQRAVKATFVVSALSVAGVAAIALLPVPGIVARRRHGDDDPAAADPGDPDDGGRS